MMQSGSGSLVAHSVDDSDKTNTTIKRYISENMGHSVYLPAEDALALAFYDLYLMSFYEPDGTWTFNTDPAAILSENMQVYDVWAVIKLMGQETQEDHCGCFLIPFLFANEKDLLE